jgi:hypothetical protein
MEIENFNEILSKSTKGIFDNWRLYTNFLITKVGLNQIDLSLVKTFSKIKIYIYFGAQMFFYIPEFLYYILNLYIIKIIYIFICPKVDLTRNKYYIIDSYTLQDIKTDSEDILKGYFPGLLDEFKMSNLNFLILPRLFDLSSILKFYKYFKILKSNRNVIFDFRFIFFSDLFEFIKHLILYPIQIILLTNKLQENNVSMVFVKKLIKSIRADTIYGLIRYHTAKRIVNFLNHDSVIIQWSENQPFDICFNLGAREIQKDINIIGTQLFIWPPELYNFHYYRENFKHYPNKILVNGPYYLRNSDKLKFEIGPSLRYKKVFKTDIQSNKSGFILILFSYFSNANKYLINFLNNVNLEQKVLIKFHPANNQKQIKRSLRIDCKISNTNIYDLFTETILVIGNNSGSLVEAIACGIPVFLNDIEDSIKLTYLPNYSKGILFDEGDSNEFEFKKRSLLNLVENKSNSRLKMIKKVRNDFFTFPSNELIKKSFEF